MDELIATFKEKDLHLLNMGDYLYHKRRMYVDLNSVDLEDYALFKEHKGEKTKYTMYLSEHHKFCYTHWRPYDIRNYSIEGFKG